MRWARFLLPVVLLAAVPRFADGLTLYSIGPDTDPVFPVPRSLYSMTAGGAATRLFDLGNGSLGFNGGLAFDPGSDLFYSIANDGFGSSSLVSFSLAGGASLQTIAPLGSGFASGLAYDTSDGFLYAISNDGSGNSTLNRISTGGVVSALGSLGMGFYGGLTFRPADGLLYAFSADVFGVQRAFNSITPVASPTVITPFLLGDGSESFNGGFAFSEQGGLFYAISNDWLGASRLQTFTLNGGLAPVGGIPGGFINVGLVAVAPVPEPSSWLLVVTCLVAGLLVRRRPRA
ncbi:MAG: PEP-CTERM sorting domain-containing protein [Acidobacteria bacterium]|nr:PEP-CTERM sorting domain-containing protein [Acidobacteriota bacterium]